MTPGQMPTLSGLAQPAQIGTAGLPPEILTGIMQSADKINSMFDAFAQVTPDMTNEWELCKAVLQRAVGKLLVAGGGPTSPTATGPQFPGGGTDAGVPKSPSSPV